MRGTITKVFSHLENFVVLHHRRSSQGYGTFRGFHDKAKVVNSILNNSYFAKKKEGHKLSEQVFPKTKREEKKK